MLIRNRLAVDTAREAVAVLRNETELPSFIEWEELTTLKGVRRWSVFISWGSTWALCLVSQEPGQHAYIARIKVGGHWLGEVNFSYKALTHICGHGCTIR